MFQSKIDRYQAYAPLVLRLAVGIVFLAHGISKFGDLAGFTQMVVGIGMPAASLLAGVVAAIETIGGLALILGVGTRIAAALLAVILVVAIVTIKAELGLIAPMGAPLPGAELDLALLAGCIAKSPCGD